MKVAIIGTGFIGGILGRALVGRGARGHVRFSPRR